MQDLLAKLLWQNDEITEAAGRLCQSLPGYQEAREDYDSLAEQIQNIVGYKLYDQYFTQLIRYTNYEVRAYYALGLGLREDIVRGLDF